MTALKIENLCKSFGKRQIIKNISFEVNRGEVYGFLGPNGSGKTTTIKMVLGLLAIDSGRVEIGGFDRQKQFEKAMSQVGGVVENPDTYNYLTARKNLEVYARARGTVDQKRIDEVLQLVGLQNRAGDRVKRYSLGMKQRLGIAQAIVHRPQVLVLDEPTNGLDPNGIRELRDLLKHLAHEENLAVLVSSHLLSEMQLMCDRVCIIENGSILRVEELGALMHEKKDTHYHFVLRPAFQAIGALREAVGDEAIVSQSNDSFELKIEEEQVPRLVAKMVQSGVDVMTVQPIQRTLEDSFIEITKGGNGIE